MLVLKWGFRCLEVLGGGGGNFLISRRTGLWTLVQVGPFVARGREIIGAWEKLPMPVIAALDGVR